MIMSVDDETRAASALAVRVNGAAPTAMRAPQGERSGVRGLLRSAARREWDRRETVPVVGVNGTPIERRDGELAVITPGHVAEARRDLGRRLAALREAAGLTQADLAVRVSYSRSTIGNVETGRQKIPRGFWQCCDRELGADGVLLAAHDDVEALVRRYHMTVALDSGQRREAFGGSTGRVDGNRGADLATGDVGGADVRGLLTSGAQGARDCHYTLHLDFAADSPAAARELAVTLAEGLGILRDEVQTYSARLSAGARWVEAESLFCTAGGPEGAFCGSAAGRTGPHAEAGVDGLRRGDGDEGEGEG